MPVKILELQNNSHLGMDQGPQLGLKITWEITSYISAGSKGAVA